MWTIQKEIKKVVRDIQIGSDKFHRLDERREHKVLQDVKRHFLTDFDASLWCECFRYESHSRALHNPHKHLPELCPNEGKKIWLIPCESDESVYDTFPEIAVLIIEECPPFEYAVVDKKLEWLFLDTHRNLMYACGPTAIMRLKKIREQPTDS